jgi:UDP-glucose 4-epimerase
MSKTYLLTCSLCYIDSHIAVQFLSKKTDDIVIIIDNLSNSNENKLYKIKNNILKENIKNLFYYKIEMLNYDELDKLFIKNKIDIVIYSKLEIYCKFTVIFWNTFMYVRKYRYKPEC